MSRRALSSEEEARRRKLYREGLNDKEIAQAVGLNHHSIYVWRRNRGLPVNRRRGKGKRHDIDARRKKMFEAGLTDEEMARQEGVAKGTIASWRWKHQLGRLPKQQRNYKTSYRTKNIAKNYPRANVRFLQAFERDLLRVADGRYGHALDISMFLEAWRDSQADEVINDIEKKEKGRGG